MKTMLIIGLCLGTIATSPAERVLAEFDWSKSADAGRLLGGAVVSLDGRSAVKVVNTNDTPLQTQLFKVVNPPIKKKLYAIIGELRYDAVRGSGYLEMWNFFPPAKPGMAEDAYFSRTLGESGEMGQLTGTSGWRRFVLPFDRTGSSQPPTRLEINLFLPSQGTVYLGPVKLVEYEGRLGAMGNGAADAWWPEWAGGLIGGIGGGLLGCVGGLLGWLAGKGRARGFVLGSLMALVVLGALSTLAGFVALSLEQPYGVWFALLLPGVILLGICPVGLRQYRRRYDDLELRRMVAMDA